MEQARLNSGNFVWDRIKNVDELGDVRMRAMKKFIKDYEKGLEEGRYIPEQLPLLPFYDGAFDIALSSHFLFLYSGHLDFAFHLKSIREMCRVAREARIFPLVDLDIKPSPYVGQIMEVLAKEGYEVVIEKVDYEFQRGADRMLKVRRNNYGTD